MTKQNIVFKTSPLKSYFSMCKLLLDFAATQLSQITFFSNPNKAGLFQCSFFFGVIIVKQPI